MVCNEKRKPVFIKWKWNHVVFSWATILSFHPVYIYKEDLILNNLQWLICHKTWANQTIIIYLHTVIWFQGGAHGGMVTVVGNVQILNKTILTISLHLWVNNRRLNSLTLVGPLVLEKETSEFKSVNSSPIKNWTYVKSYTRCYIYIYISTHRYVNYFISKSWWWLINRNVNVDFTPWYIHLFGLYFFLLPSYCRILSIFTFILSFRKKHIPNTFLHNI